MPACSDRAIVLRTGVYSETSQTVLLLTEQHGRVSLLAKGARRSTRTRVAVGLDLLELGEVGFVPPRPGAGLGTLTEWVQRDAFAALRDNLLTLYAALYAAERIGALTAELDPHPGLFAATVALLEDLCTAARSNPSPAPVATALVRFQSALLRRIGYAPNLRRCVRCGKARPPGAAAYFSPASGGLLCRTCARGESGTRRLPAGMLEGSAPARDAPLWFDLLDDYLTYLAHRPAGCADLLRHRLHAARPQTASKRDDRGRGGSSVV